MTIKIKKLQTTWIMLVEEFQKVFTIELKFSFIFVLNFQIFLFVIKLKIFIIIIYLFRELISYIIFSKFTFN